MTIRSSKDYDQHAHEQPTQATTWAGQMGADTTRALRSAAAGEAPWHQSYDAHAARPLSPPTGPTPEAAAPMAKRGFNDMSPEEMRTAGAGYQSKRKDPAYASYYRDQDREDRDQARRME